MESNAKRQRTLLSFVGKSKEDSFPERKYSWKRHGSLLIFKNCVNDQINVTLPQGIAAFDLDETIITTSSNCKFARNEKDWKFLYPNVPKRLREQISNTSNQHPIIFIFTNQLGIGRDSTGKREEMFKLKMENICSLLNIPIILVAAVEEDFNRKPCPGMWEFVQNHFGLQFDKEKSFFVGDAAGRPKDWRKGKKEDHASTDRKFALNIGIKFLTPEQYFHDDGDHPFSPDQFIPTSLLTDKSMEESRDDLHGALNLISDSLEKDKVVILFVGPPASGKSSFYRRHFKSLSFDWINQDELGSKAKCLQKYKDCLTNGRNVVVDNTNPSSSVRQEYIELAKSHNYKVYCLYFQIPEYISIHLDAHRSITKGKPRLPYLALISYQKRFQTPLIEEGFEKVLSIPFHPQFDSEEEERIFKYFLV